MTPGKDVEELGTRTRNSDSELGLGTRTRNTDSEMNVMAPEDAETTSKAPEKD